jgi:hypothetical protein
MDLRKRLAIDQVTLPPADLLLTKMQVVEITAKDLSDAAMLLLDHAPADRDGDTTIDAGYLAELGARDWGLHTTVTDNLALLSRAVDTMGLDQISRERVIIRAGQVVARMEQAPKSRSWKMRAKVGRRVRWYEVPEEIGR